MIQIMDLNEKKKRQYGSHCPNMGNETVARDARICGRGRNADCSRSRTRGRVGAAGKQPAPRLGGLMAWP